MVVGLLDQKLDFFRKNKDEIPKYDELKLSSGPMNIPNLKLIELAQYFFLILFFILIFYSLIFCLSFFRIIKTKLDFEIYSIILLIQSYLILICFTNVSTPRYLMVVYSHVNYSFNRFFKQNTKKYNKKN